MGSFFGVKIRDLSVMIGQGYGGFSFSDGFGAGRY